MPGLTLSIVEIIVLMTGAITLGITIHFFIVSRRSLRASMNPLPAGRVTDEWKQRYFNDMERKEKELSELKKRAEDAEADYRSLSHDQDELRRKLAIAEKERPAGLVDKTTYLDQLKQAQQSLQEHNEKINRLLGEIEYAHEKEQQQEEIQRGNEELEAEVEDLRTLLAHKERELQETRQKMSMSKEMSSMLDNAYTEFQSLQDKIHKLEGQVSSSRMLNLEYEDLKESHFRVSRELQEQKQKFQSASNDAMELRSILDETEEKLKEANFQRQQLQKRVAYLEEMNHDMQIVAETNRKLEVQLKRIGELESMLNVVAEERDELAKNLNR